MKYEDPKLSEDGFVVNPGGGKKEMGNKPETCQVPEEFVHALNEQMKRGMEKYGFGNWARGMKASQLMEAARRHLYAMRVGEDIDPGTGQHHILAVAANAMMYFCCMDNGNLIDDRKAAYIDAFLEAIFQGDEP